MIGETTAWFIYSFVGSGLFRKPHEILIFEDLFGDAIICIGSACGKDMIPLEIKKHVVQPGPHRGCSGSAASRAPVGESARMSYEIIWALKNLIIINCISFVRDCNPCMG